MSIPIYFLLTNALVAHWKAHDNKYPQKVLLTPVQHQALCEYRYMASSSKPSADRASRAVAGEKFMGVLIEHNDTTPGVMVAIDGTEIPLAQN